LLPNRLKENKSNPPTITTTKKQKNNKKITKKKKWRKKEKRMGWIPFFITAFNDCIQVYFF